MKKEIFYKNLPKICAVLLLLQGLSPALGLGILRPGGWFFAVVVIICCLLAWGVWRSKRWGFIAALIFTVPQMVSVNSAFISWQLIVGPAFGAMVIPPNLNPLNAQISFFFSPINAEFIGSYREPLPGPCPAMMFNSVAIAIGACLLAAYLRSFKPNLKAVP